MSKRFGRTKALEAVSLEISPGVVFALLGENGAGKTTLIRILTGFLQPDYGDAWVLGHRCVREAQEIRAQDWLRLRCAGFVRVDDARRNRLVHLGVLSGRIQ